MPCWWGKVAAFARTRELLGVVWSFLGGPRSGECGYSECGYSATQLPPISPDRLKACPTDHFNETWHRE